MTKIMFNSRKWCVLLCPKSQTGKKRAKFE